MLVACAHADLKSYDFQSWLLMIRHVLQVLTSSTGSFTSTLTFSLCTLSGKLELERLSVSLHAGRAKWILVQAVKVRVRGRKESAAGREFSSVARDTAVR